jgi:hypothetical protein
MGMSPRAISAVALTALGVGLVWRLLAASDHRIAATLGTVLIGLGLVALCTAWVLHAGGGSKPASGGATRAGGTASLGFGALGLLVAQVPVFGWLLGGIAVGLANRTFRRKEWRPWRAEAGFALGVLAVVLGAAAFGANVAAGVARL